MAAANISNVPIVVISAKVRHKPQKAKVSPLYYGTLMLLLLITVPCCPFGQKANQHLSAKNANELIFSYAFIQSSNNRVMRD
jgi:hypothetical protein